MDTEKMNQGLGLPSLAALMMAIVCALVVGASFVVIKYWPLPASVAPYMGFTSGCWWGAVVGGITGLVLGFLVDDKHFSQNG